MQFPSRIENEQELEQLLSQPSDGVIRAMTRMRGDFMFLGAGGKLGFSLAMMTKRASEAAGVSRAYYAVSRFEESVVAERFESEGISAIPVDLLERASRVTLPKTTNVVLLLEHKLGTTENPAHAWVMNVVLPALLASRFPKSRLFAFSSGNVYPFVPNESEGSVETDRLDPVGEYGMTILGRERVLERHCRMRQVPVSIGRLSNAEEVRHGVLVDIGLAAFHGSPIDLSMSHINVIWQGDANALALQAMADAASPPHIVNLAGSEVVSVREIALRFAERFGKPLEFIGDPHPTSLLSNGGLAHDTYGAPTVGVEQMIDWISDWIVRGQHLYDQPTLFHRRDGMF